MQAPPSNAYTSGSIQPANRSRLFVLRDSKLIHAPIDRCFLLSTSVAIVHQELGMDAVSGRTEGLVHDGDVIRWEGWQLGMPQFHVSQIARYQRPAFFQDRMLDGRFQFFEHDHHLRETAEGTLLEDELRFTMPFGVIGNLIGRWVMVPHIRRLMRDHFRRLKSIAETERWHEYIPADEITRPATPGST